MRPIRVMRPVPSGVPSLVQSCRPIPFSSPAAKKILPPRVTGVKGGVKGGLNGWGPRSARRKVPWEVPSVAHRIGPLRKKSLPRARMKLEGCELHGPGQTSKTRRVPAPVPSVLHSSVPWAGSEPWNRHPVAQGHELGREAGGRTAAGAALQRRRGGRRAAARPEPHASETVAGDEDEPVSRLAELQLVAAVAPERASVAEVGDPPRAGRSAVAPPQVGSARDVVGDEVDDAVEGLQRQARMERVLRDELRHRARPGHRAVARPELLTPACRSLRHEEDPRARRGEQPGIVEEAVAAVPEVSEMEGAGLGAVRPPEALKTRRRRACRRRARAFPPRGGCGM